MAKNHVLFGLLMMACSASAQTASQNHEQIKILKLEMHLSAFGVESDDFPSINGFIDFEKDSSHCERSFYNPAYSGSVYVFSAAETSQILELLQQLEPDRLKPRYTINRSDQPTSTIIIHTSAQKYTVEDYGLKGEEVLVRLYNMIYKI